MSAAHCFLGDFYDGFKFFYVGTHHIVDSSTGQRIEKTSIEGIDKDGNRVQFPIDAAIHSIETNLIDIAVITLDRDIVFTENIKKVRLESPKTAFDDCLICSGDCNPSINFKVYGWGLYLPGIL